MVSLHIQRGWRMIVCWLEYYPPYCEHFREYFLKKLKNITPFLPKIRCIIIMFALITIIFFTNFVFTIFLNENIYIFSSGFVMELLSEQREISSNRSRRVCISSRLGIRLMGSRISIRWKFRRTGGWLLFANKRVKLDRNFGAVS